MTDHKVVSRAEWQAAREELLQREKEQTRMADELARQRRELPWVAIEKQYRFDTDHGMRILAELFEGRSQLLIYHFMFGPSYEAGCPVNSSMVDGFDGLLPHLHARDVTLLLVSQAPLDKLQAYKQRMGWRIPWVSAAATNFNFDLGVSYTPEQVREFLAPGQATLPPIVAQNAGGLRPGKVLGLQQPHEEEVVPAVWVQPGFAADSLLTETAGQVAVDGAAIAGQHLQLDAMRPQDAEGPGQNQPGWRMARSPAEADDQPGGGPRACCLGSSGGTIKPAFRGTSARHGAPC
jgi:predicted dithiol-disulfide oxidoreductase (DUF899 family)